LNPKFFIYLPKLKKSHISIPSAVVTLISLYCCLLQTQWLTMGSNKRSSNSVEKAEESVEGEIQLANPIKKKLKKDHKTKGIGNVDATAVSEVKPMERKKKRKESDKARHKKNEQEKPKQMDVDETDRGEMVASSSKGLPAFHIDVFKDLASADASVREAGVERLVTELQKVQNAYEGNKELYESGLKLEADKDDGLNDTAPSVRYAIRRLIRGASSPREEAKDCLLGRLFSYGALARSGRLNELCISDPNTPVIKEFVSVLLTLATKKSYLPEPVVTVILNLAEKLQVEHVLNHVLEAPGFSEWFSDAVDTGNPDALLLALKLREKVSVDTLKFGKVLPYPFSPSSFFSSEHLNLLNNCWKHLALNILLLLLPRLPASLVPVVLSDKLVQGLMDILSTKDSWLYKVAQHFIKELSDWVGNDDVRRVAVIVALQKHSNGRFDSITKTKTVKALLAEFKTESGCLLFIQNLANLFVDESNASDEPSDQSQTTDDNSEMGSLEDKDSGVLGNSDSLKSWIVESLPSILKFLKLDPEEKLRVQKEIFKFLAVQGLFSSSLGSEVTSFELQEKFTWPKAATSSAICRICIEQIQSLLASAQKMESSPALLNGSETSDLGSFFMQFLSTLRSIPTVSLFRILNDEDEKAYQKLLVTEASLRKQAFVNPQTTEVSEQLGQRIWGILNKKILKAKDFPKGADVNHSMLVSLLERNLKLASRPFKKKKSAADQSKKKQASAQKRHKMIASLSQDSTFWILKIIDASKFSGEELESVFGSLKNMLTGFFDSKKCPIKSGFVKELFKRRPWIGHHLFEFLLDKCCSSKLEFRRVEALDLVLEVLKSMAGKKALRSRLQKLSELVKELVTNMPEKQSRHADVRKFCGKVFQIISVNELAKSFLKLIDKDAQTSCELRLGQVFLNFKNGEQQK
ncbi:hypothetical protein LINPERPRIM_LOCUS19441, partial [Linum perenne]